MLHGEVEQRVPVEDPGPGTGAARRTPAPAPGQQLRDGGLAVSSADRDVMTTLVRRMLSLHRSQLRRQGCHDNTCNDNTPD